MKETLRGSSNMRGSSIIYGGVLPFQLDYMDRNICIFHIHLVLFLMTMYGHFLFFLDRGHLDDSRALIKVKILFGLHRDISA